jgi:NAD(P)-dependent dehydrogenase (short-subunit alcohol dehydrogenase family)
VIGYRRGLDLDGSVVAVTGAASGIGRATVLALADRGARPVLLGPPGDALLEAAAECVARGVAALPLTVDVTDGDAVAGAAASVPAPPARRWSGSVGSTAGSPCPTTPR